MKDRVYIGLATTFHDPAIAIVGPGGTVRFAEAAERFLQYKRAPNCEPDPAAYVAGLLDRYVETDADVVIATTWSEPFAAGLVNRAARGVFTPDRLVGVDRRLNRSMVPEVAYQGLLASLHWQQQRAGLSTVLLLARRRPDTKVACRRYDHHLTHAAYAAWGAPFDEAAVLVVDGMGETGAAVIFYLKDGAVTLVRRHIGLESIGFCSG